MDEQTEDPKLWPVNISRTGNRKEFLAIVVHRHFLKMKEKCMKVGGSVFATTTKEISSKVSPSLHCLLYWLSQTGCLKIHKETKTHVCLCPGRHFHCPLTAPESEVTAETNSSGSCRFMCSLHPFQTCWWCCLFGLQSSYPFTSPTSFFSTRISYSAENQLVGCKPGQLKGLPRLVGTTASQQHAHMMSLTLVFAWGICELFAFSRCCAACSCCSEEGVYLATSAHCTVRPKVSLFAPFPFCIAILCSAIVSYYLI